MAASQKSYWLKSGFLSLLEKGSVFVFGFGSVFFLLRGLSMDDYGTYVLFLAITAFIEVGRNGLLQNALVKFLSTCEPEETGRIATASISISLGLTLICILILLLFGELFGRMLNAPGLGLLLRIYCITTLILIPFHQFNFIQQANLDFSGIFWSNFINKGLFFAFLAILFFFSYEFSLVYIVTFQAFAALMGAFATCWIGRKYLHFSWTIDWSWVKTLFNYGRFIFGTNLNAMIHKKIDTLMLGNLLGPAASGIYDLAIRITNLVEVPTFSVASIVFPQSARRMETDGKEAIRYLYERSVGLILAIILPFLAFVFIFAKYIILLLASDKGADAVQVLQVTIFFGLFIPYAVQFGTVLDSIGKPKLNFRFTLVGATLNIVCNYIFITRFGVMGAAYGTLTTYAIIFVATQIVLNRLIGVKPQNALVYMLHFYTKEIPKGLQTIRQKLMASRA
ncbi:MAG: flippase [Bacteroidota bacterium]